MDFRKLALCQHMLRQKALGKQKIALAGLVTKPLAWAARKAVNNPMGAAVGAATLYGGGATVNAGVQRARAFNSGMHPAALSYSNTPIQ